MRPRLVLFDCDGVLVDSEAMSSRLLAEHLTIIGLPTSTDECYERYLGNSAAATLADVKQRLGGPVPEGFVARYVAAQHAQLAQVRAVDGVVDVLDALDALGVLSCVASSGDHAKLEISLGASGLACRFSGRIFSATEVQHGKPAPDLFLHAAAQTDVDPRECVVIEDAPIGVAAARAAGMQVIGYAGLTPAWRLRDANRVVQHMVDVVPLLTA